MSWTEVRYGLHPRVHGYEYDLTDACEYHPRRLQTTDLDQRGRVVVLSRVQNHVLRHGGRLNPVVEIDWTNLSISRKSRS